MKSLRSWILAATVLLGAVTPGCPGCGPECPDPENPECAPVCTVGSVDILSPVDGTRYGLDDDTSGGSQLPAAITIAEVVVQALDADGNPTAGATIVLSTNGGSEVTAVTDANGTASFPDFRLEADPADDMVVNLLEAREENGCANDAATVDVDVAPPACVFVVPEANAVITCADDADGMPLNGIQTSVTVSSDAGNGNTVRVVIDGDQANPLVGTLNAGSVTFSSTLPPGLGTAVSLEAECLDDAGNVGTEAIGVTVDCDVPLCEIAAVSPGGGADMCISLADGEESQTAEIAITGLTGGKIVELFVDGPAGPCMLGGTSTTTGTASVPFTVDGGCFADDPAGGLNTLTCTATEIAPPGNSAFPVPFAVGCVETNIPDPAPDYFFPLCGIVFPESADSDPVAAGFQHDFTIEVCCADYTMEVDCGAGATAYTPPGAPPGYPTGCGTVVIPDVDMEVDAPCTFTAWCVDDATGTMSPTNVCTGFMVSSLPVVTITDPPPTATLGIDDDDDPVAPGFQVNVSGTALPAGSLANVLLTDGAGGMSMPVSGSGSFSDTVTYTMDGTYTITADAPTPGTAVPDTSVVTIDLTPPLAPSALGCVVIEHRAGEIECTWTVPATSCVESVVLRWGDDPATFDFDTSFVGSSTVDAPPAGAGCSTGGVQTFTFFGPRIGDDVVVAVASVDDAGNRSAPTSPVSLGVLAPLQLSLTVMGGAAGDGLGAAVAGGDFDCDGADDLAVSAPFEDGGLGAIYVWSGPVGTTSPAVTAPSSLGTLAYLGAGMATIGDWNGDGCDDLAVAAPGWGQVRILLGSAAGLPATLSETSGLRITAPAGYGSFQFGYGFYATSSLAGGDLDGDGLADLVVGCDDCPVGGAGNPGEAYVFRGTLSPGAGAIGAATADVILEGDAAGDGFGSSVAYLGPIAPGGPSAGRGLAVGAPRYAFYGGVPTDVGYAAVFQWPLGAGPLTPGADAAAVFDALLAGSFGSSIAGSGTFGMSTLGGVVVGGRDITGAGRGYLFLNAAIAAGGGTTATATLELISPVSSSTAEFTLGLASGYVPGGVFGGTVATFDADATSDIMASNRVGGDPCRVAGLYGDAVPLATPPYDSCFTGPAAIGADPVYNMTFAGDLDGDAYVDVAVGYPVSAAGAGSVIVYH